jgi:tRNA A37 threonylcarbamoyladenosine dehydratase
VSFNDRNRIILGEAGLARLSRARVAVYGLGGVGGACALDLVRSGVGSILVFDFDTVDESNLNRLAYGFRSCLGLSKAEALKRAALDINPQAEVSCVGGFISGNDAAASLPAGMDAAVDAIDSLNPKVMLVKALLDSGKPFVSVQGMGGRIAPERVKRGRLSESSGCPLARELRNRLRRLGCSLDFEAVWSDEKPVPPIPAAHSAPDEAVPPSKGRPRMIQGSLPFVPQTAGHLAASIIVRLLISYPDKME